MMRFVELVGKRYSCRKYKTIPVEEEKLIYILECGRKAPSAANRQPWKIFVIQGKELLHQLHRSYQREWFWQAPVVLVFCGDHSLSWVRQKDGKDHCDIDVAIIVDHVTLAATESGLATCWICAFDPDVVREVLHLPEHLEPLVLLPLGYPDDVGDENRHLQKRLPLNEIVTFIK